ncbi:copper chaperone PCu(A)C [Meiothermus sp.]|uniref:copper chaperone PCu(A)C n=1 Tax=Meiothermus sp. TaxID=1955249 RepID=UPI00307EB6E6
MLIRFGVILWALGWVFAQGQGLRVENAWIRLVPGRITAAYMVLVNTTPHPIRVLGVGSPIAARGELHRTQFVDPSDHLGMDHSHSPEMKGLEMTGMRPVKELLVPARGRLELKPGGIHLMLIDLRQPLRQGQQVRLTLQLEGGRTFHVDAVVRAQ